MQRADKLVVFSIEGQRFGLDMLAVERVVPAVEVTHIPGLPDHLLGLICVKGSDVPVLDMRRLLGLPGRAVAARDKMIIVGGPEQTIALVIDEVTGFADCPERCPAQGGPPSETGEIIVGSLNDDDGMILVCNEDLLLLRGEAPGLDAIQAAG